VRAFKSGIEREAETERARGVDWRLVRAPIGGSKSDPAVNVASPDPLPFPPSTAMFYANVTSPSRLQV
jgi:hypothetical protein